MFDNPRGTLTAFDHAERTDLIEVMLSELEIDIGHLSVDGRQGLISNIRTKKWSFLILPSSFCSIGHLLEVLIGCARTEELIQRLSHKNFAKRLALDVFHDDKGTDSDEAVVVGCAVRNNFRYRYVGLLVEVAHCGNFVLNLRLRVHHSTRYGEADHPASTVILAIFELDGNAVVEAASSNGERVAWLVVVVHGCQLGDVVTDTVHDDLPLTNDLVLLGEMDLIDVHCGNSNLLSCIKVSIEAASS